MHSKSNPAQESVLNSEQAVTAAERGEGFFLVMGIGAGYHIKNLLEVLTKNSSHGNGTFCIVCVEADAESLDFCMEFSCVKELADNQNITLCSKDLLSDILTEKYVPSMYGNLFILPQRAWQNENKVSFCQIEDIVRASLKDISDDYSVQAHFGKIWMSNILGNLRTFKSNNSINFDTTLTAAVIAAGPSLDDTIKVLKDKRSSYCIISTDTAYGTLVKTGIIPDITVSVDAQFVSVSHFYGCPSGKGTGTTFIFDICTNPSAAVYLKGKGHKVFFIQSGHPLSRLASNTADFPFVETGAGTVTIACCDIARLLGFNKIELFGADFAYSRGKPYTRGTYLETQFMSSATRILPQETRFTALMYRTSLKQISGERLACKKAYSSEVLERYQSALSEWAFKYGYERNGNLLTGTKACSCRLNNVNKKTFNFMTFMEHWSEELKNRSCMETLLPYIAFLQTRKYENIGIFELYNLAYSKVIRYNKWI